MAIQVHDDDPAGNIYAWHDNSESCELMTENPTGAYWANITSPKNLAHMQWDHIARLHTPPRAHVFTTRTRWNRTANGPEAERYSVRLS